MHDTSAAGHTLSYGKFTPAALRALSQVARDADRDLHAVTAPTLVVQSRQDNRISGAAAERAFAKLGAAEKQLVWTDGAGHVITVDFGHERVFELTADWLERHLNVQPTPSAPSERDREGSRPRP